MNAKRAGSLFALTLTAGTLGVAGSASAADCGTPAVDAVYRTVSHEAVTHVEKRWTRTVVDTPAQAAWDEPAVVVPDSYKTVTETVKEAWDETKTITEAWDEKVIDQQAQDAVYITVYLWRHKVTHEERWEPEDWNGKSYSESWQLIPGRSREQVVTEAVPEISHIVHHDAVTEVVHHPAETRDVQVLVPGYTIPAVHHDAVAEVSHVEEKWAAESPGSDWADTGDSRVVTDKAAWDEQVLVTPAKPAGPKCPTDTTGGGETGGGENGGGTTGGGSNGGDTSGGHEVAQPTRDKATHVRHAGTHATSRATAEASAVPTRLAYTGSDTAEYALVGAFLLAGGVVLSVRARRIGA